MIFGNWGSELGNKVGNTKQDIIKLMLENSKISAEILSEKLSINVKVVERHIRNLKEQGFIERIGGTRGYWLVKINDSSD